MNKILQLKSFIQLYPFGVLTLGSYRCSASQPKETVRPRAIKPEKPLSPFSGFKTFPKGILRMDISSSLAGERWESGAAPQGTHRVATSKV